MNAFAGLVSLNNASLPREVEGRILNAMFVRQPRHAATARSAHGFFIEEVGSRNASGHAVRPSSRADDRTLFAAAARLDNREELGSVFGIDRPALAQMSDAMLVLRAFESAGDAGLAKIVGTFAFALWDEETRRLVLARDCLGNAALFYCARPDFVAFATTLNVLLALPGVPREIDEVLLGNFLALNLRENRRTLYRGIERVPSRTRVTINGAGIRHARYWTPNPQAQPVYAREQDSIERARELLDQAVAAAMRDTPRAALFLSGGLDSSAVAATCARLGLAGRIACYTGVPPRGVPLDVGEKRYADERGKVEALHRLHPALDMHYIVPPDVHPLDEDAARYFALYGLPVRNVENLGWFAGLQDAIDPEARTVLVGTSGNFGLTWDGLFSLVELLRAGRLRDFAHELAATARESGRSAVLTFHGEVTLRMMPDRLYRLYHRLRGRDPDDVRRYSMLNPEFAAEHGLAAQWRSQGHNPLFGVRGMSGAQFRAYHLFDHAQSGRDARVLNFQSIGRQIRDPLADRRLLEFCLSVPEPLYRQNGVPRSFARRVLADRLPPEILNERRRGAQAPAWFRSLDARRNDIAQDIERFEASPLARRLLDLPRMKRLMAEWPKDAQAAQARRQEYKLALYRGVHAGRFIRWIEGGNA